MFTLGLDNHFLSLCLLKPNSRYIRTRYKYVRLHLIYLHLIIANYFMARVSYLSEENALFGIILENNLASHCSRQKPGDELLCLMSGSFPRCHSSMRSPFNVIIITITIIIAIITVLIFCCFQSMSSSWFSWKLFKTEIDILSGKRKVTIQRPLSHVAVPQFSRCLGFV